MRLSFMTFACPQWSLRKVIYAASEHGYHGVEFRCDAGHAHGVEVGASAGDRRRTRRWLESSNIEACCLATSLQFTSDTVAASVSARLELAADIGCPGIRVFCGPAPDRMAPAQVVSKVATQLRQAARLAQQLGVAIWLETHDTMSCAALAAQAVRLAEHPMIGLNYDNLHPYRMGEQVEETFAAITGLLRHTHFHVGLSSRDTVVIKPIGHGQLPIDNMFKALAGLEYEGYLSGEWFHDQYGPDPDESLSRYRSDMASLADRHGVHLGR